MIQIVGFIFVAIAILIFVFSKLQRDNIDDSNPKNEIDLPSTIPSPPKSDKKLGNLNDLSKAGSLHEYLTLLHHKYGPVTGFHWGEKFVVCLGETQLFKDQIRVQDRATHMFLMFEPLFTPHSITYANGSDFLTRRQFYDKFFSHECVVFVFPTVMEVLDKYIGKLDDSAISGIPFPIRSFMMALSLETFVRFAFESDTSIVTEEDINELRKHYDIAWYEMERRIDGSMPEEGDERSRKFEEAVNGLKTFVNRIMNRRRTLKNLVDRDKVFIDYLIEFGVGKPNGDEIAYADALTYLVAAFHTSSLVMVWGLYYMCKKPEVFDKIRQEYQDVIGNGDITERAIAQMPYVRQVINEILRCSILAPWATRILDRDYSVMGYKLPAGTNVIHALGVASQDPQCFPQPKEFDPESHFNKNTLYEPFGVGRRKCPGYRLSYMEISVWLIELVNKFNWELAEPEKEVVPVHGLVTSPKEDILMKVSQRSF